MIAVAVVAHIERMDMVLSLADKVDPQYLLMDDGAKGCFLNHQRAWEKLTFSGAEWCVVLEDDALPVPCFRDQLAQALAVAPSPVVSLYLGTGRPKRVQPSIRAFVESGVETCWLTSEHMLHAVGIALHRNVIAPMLTHIRQVPAALLPIDRAIGHWAQASGRRVAYTWPSLVGHRDTPTVIDGHPSGESSRVMYLEDLAPLPVVTPRVAWRVGVRDRWDDSTHVLA